jgi:D-beta-D-heptose 7-phosphate kinase/D-beta-D-heptose 1-phosphate adenosyltransferase
MTTVMVNGTFDILHPGHVALLNTARSYGDYLVVAIDTDRRVTELKGPRRPVNDQNFRRVMLSNLKAVDLVVLFDNEQELADIIKTYKPDVYVKGSDWKKDTQSLAHKYCKEVIYYDRIEEYSSTKIIESIANR